MAVLSGVRHGRGDWLVVLDGDGQNDPPTFPPCWRRPGVASPSDKHQVGLIGHRVNRRDDWVKRLSSKLANGFRDLLLRMASRIPAAASGGARDWYLRLPGFNHMHRYIPAPIQAQGGRMSPWPVNHRPGRRVSPNGVWNRLWVGLVDVVGVWWLQRRSKVVEIRGDIGVIDALLSMPSIWLDRDELALHVGGLHLGGWR